MTKTSGRNDLLQLFQYGGTLEMEQKTKKQQFCTLKYKASDMRDAMRLNGNVIKLKKKHEEVDHHCSSSELKKNT